MRYIESSFVGRDELSWWIEFHDALIAVAVSYEEDSIGGHSYVRWLAKVILIRTGHEGLSECQAGWMASLGKLFFFKKGKRFYFDEDIYK